MVKGTVCDGFAKGNDPVGNGFCIRSAQCFQSCLCNRIEIRLIALDELDDQRLLRLEVVIEAAWKDPGGISDLFEGGA